MTTPTGATGASPTPSTGASTPAASPAPTTSAAPSPSTSGTTKKLDYGMGPATKPSAEPQAQPTATPTQYDDAWWSQHGEHVFKHDRFKELVDVKNKYKDVEPVIGAVERMGGLDQLEQFYQYFGPVWSHLVGQGEKANETWQKLAPIFQNLLSGKDLFPQVTVPNQNPDVGDDDYDDDPKYKALTEQINALKTQLSETGNKFKTIEERDRQAAINRLQETRVTNYGKYEKMLKDNFAQNKIPVELEDFAGHLIAQNVGKYMRKDSKGRSINALDLFSEDAFKQAFTNDVLPRVKAASAAILNSAKTTVEGGGAVLPNTHSNGITVDPNSQKRFASPTEKAAKFALGMQNLKG